MRTGSRATSMSNISDQNLSHNTNKKPIHLSHISHSDSTIMRGDRSHARMQSISPPRKGKTGKVALSHILERMYLVKSRAKIARMLTYWRRIASRGLIFRRRFAHVTYRRLRRTMFLALRLWTDFNVLRRTRKQLCAKGSKNRSLQMSREFFVAWREIIGARGSVRGKTQDVLGDLIMGSPCDVVCVYICVNVCVCVMVMHV